MHRAWPCQAGIRLDDYLVNRDQHGPTRLIYALAFDKLHTLDGYDRDRDPEEVFETITTWLTDKEAKNPSEGALRYHQERLKGIGSSETVRGLFYQGRRIRVPNSKQQEMD